MRYPWVSDSNEAELEALQTDVMRFVAILGLCLAAIFSLVQRASLEQPQPAITPETPVPAALVGNRPPEMTPTPAKPAPEAARPPPAEPTPDVPQPPVPTESQIGFSLEFASAADLMALLEQGQLQLYADVDGEFWSANARGRFSVAGAPSSYYRMDSSTVPKALVGSLQRSTTAGKVIWGVVLAPTIVKQMAHFTNTSEGGKLLIRGSGQVEMEPPH